MSQSIQHLRIYTTARDLEDRVYELVKMLPGSLDYPLGNNLRRSSAAVCHHLSEAHRCYSYSLKLDCLSQARLAAQSVQAHLGELSDSPAAAELTEGYTNLIKQAWGLIRYLKQRREERLSRSAVRATDELVAART